MPITKMTKMWNRLDAYNLNGERNERPVNHLNEWGGFSRFLEMPVFTAWFDQLEYDKSTKLTTALINDTNWARPVGVNNQERWIAVVEQAGGGIAAFFIIHAVDVNSERRVVRNIDDDKVFVGKLARDGTATFILGQPRFL